MIVQSSLHIYFMFQILRLWQKIKQPLHDLYGKIQQCEHYKITKNTNFIAKLGWSRKN
jgi:hypothetical protein